MTDSFSRLISLPFALVLIFVFSSGGLESFGVKTILIFISLAALILIYIFNRPINIWWWKMRMPKLEKPLLAWLGRYSKYYKGLGREEKEEFSGRIATFNKIKNFTLKGKRDYQLEEDVKTIIAHDFVRVGQRRKEFLFESFDHFIVYNHPFVSPNIQNFHTLEIFDSDEVVILSKEQLINGFLDPRKYVNIAMLAAIMIFTDLYPRLPYPEVANLELAEIAGQLDLDLDIMLMALGSDWINRLDLLIYCYFLFPEQLEQSYPDKYADLQKIF